VAGDLIVCDRDESRVLVSAPRHGLDLTVAGGGGIWTELQIICKEIISSGSRDRRSRDQMTVRSPQDI
jgi:hypothetical protein